jgi:hypothetical protein
LQRASIISHKFLDTLSCELVCDVEALPWKVQVQLLVGDRFEELRSVPQMK